MSKSDNQLSFREFLGFRELPRFAVLNLVFLYTLDGVLCEFLKLPNECETTSHV